MNKNLYQLKHYRNGSYLKTINPDTIKSNVSFVGNQNGGQGQMRLEISEAFIDNDYQYNDIIKVYLFNEYNELGILIYNGFIQEINQKATNSELIELGLIGVVGLLSGIMYRSGSSAKFTKNDTPINILTEILTSFNTISNVDITLGETISTPTNINIDFDHTYCIDAIKKVMEFVDGYWYIDQNQKLHIRQHEVKHKLTYKKNIQSMDIRGDIGIYNRLHLFFNGADKQYDDTTSQGLYGIREKKVTDTNIKNVGTADQFGAERLSENAYPQKKTRLVITDKYVIDEGDDYYWDDSAGNWNDSGVGMWDESGYWVDSYAVYGSTEKIEPGDGVRINNFYEVINGNIDRMTYNDGFVTIELDKSENFIKLLKE